MEGNDPACRHRTVFMANNKIGVGVAHFTTSSMNDRICHSCVAQHMHNILWLFNKMFLIFIN